MAFHLNFNKFVLLGLSFIIILIVYHLWLNQGAVYPQLVSTENDSGVPDSFNVRFEDKSAVILYEGFTRDQRFALDERPEFKVTLDLLELERQNVADVITQALSGGQAVMGGAVKERDFQYGITRHLPGIGEEYTLVFRTGDDVFTARVYKPLKEPLVLVSRQQRLRDQRLNIVMPLCGRVDRLQKFLDRLSVIIDQGDNVHLIVVAYPDGANGTAPVAAALRRWRHADRAQLIAETGPFSRGAALLRGAAVDTSPPTDPLLFFCDVDMTFSALVLERCRVHAARGQAVYYPIVFSQYNPRLREALRQSGRWPAEPPVSDDTGHWRHYGFGMSCQYRSDFMTVGGGFLEVSGWGGEDTKLYQRYLKQLRVVRAIDEDLVHEFHGKECSERLSAEQYRGCVRSKITNEGNKMQLGLLALSAAGDLGPKAYAVFHLPWFQRPGGWATLAAVLLLVLSVALNVLQFRRNRRTPAARKG